MKAPFPWFGGKSSIVPLVWERFGQVNNYVEPFFGSGAMLLARPDWRSGMIETINDKDGFVSNFWRALQHDPEKVAEFADWPVNENDLHARHKWLVLRRRKLTERLENDPCYFEPEIAGWWVWGLCCWIGSGWCVEQSRKCPHVGNRGQGINRQLPHVGDRGRGIVEYFHALATRLRDVRICSGDWSRICGPSPTWKFGATGVFLDPPYAVNDRYEVYSEDCFEVANDVRAWAIEQGDNPLMRIALCGYDDEHDMPQTWHCERWKPKGGYGSQSKDGCGRENAKRERVWFSPHCLQARQQQLALG